MKQKLILANQTDNILHVKYNVYSMNAIELSEYLKSNLGENYKKYNSDNHKSIENIPEIYEYQLFFLYKNLNNEFKLLDGFRRLLWYDVPDTDITVRVYENLSDVQLLELMVNLNHFKFFSNQNYYDRGFSLFLSVFFDLDITENREVLDAYLSAEKVKLGFSSNIENAREQGKNILVKERILNPYFISDIRFLFELKKRGYSVLMLPALLHKLRAEIGDNFILNIDLFIQALKNNDKISSLSAKYKKIDYVGKYSSSATEVNTFVQFYEKAIKEINGIQVGLTYTEQVDEVKALIAKYKKDKKWSKLTNIRGAEKEVKVITNHIRDNGGKINMIAIVYPSDADVSRWTSHYNKNTAIPSGEYKNLLCTPIEDSGRYSFSAKRVELEITNDIFRTTNGQQYNEVVGLGEMPYTRQKCEIFYQLS